MNRGNTGTIRPKTYEAVKGGERMIGTARELSRALGVELKLFYKYAGCGHLVRGYAVRRAEPKKIQYRAYHKADVLREDPVTGDADELSEVLGLSTNRIQALANERGKCSRGGWTVEAAV